MIRSTFLLLLLALALILTVPTTTFAQKSLSPHIFVGTVMVNGEKPGDGTVITAMVDDQIVGSTTTIEGMYTMAVTSTPGAEVRFMIGWIKAAQTIEWMQGAATHLDLTDALTQNVPPHIFVGRAMIDGSYAPPGTLITAVISNDIKGRTTIGDSGFYLIVVEQGNGTHINFIIGSNKAGPAALWEQGGTTILDLDTSPIQLKVALASLIETGLLDKVFQLDNSTKIWQWYITDPTFSQYNTLAEISLGDPVWIKVKANTSVDIFYETITLTCLDAGTPDENCWNMIAIP